MSRSSLFMLALLAGAMMSTPALAQYKWRDSTGRVQYSDLPPPPGVPDKDILQQPSAAARRAPAPSVVPASAPALTPATPKVEPELEAKRKAVEQAAADKQKAEEDKLAATRASNCSNARNQLRALQDGMRLARTNDKGEREVLDDNARNEEIRKTQVVIASDCKS